MINTEQIYNAALDYLYSFVDYSLKHASELAKAEFDLDRMRVLMAALGNPERAYPIIHIAGTKGKGSVAAMCASALHAGGYHTGLYTSPHLQDYAERIQVDGTPIPHADLAELVNEIKPHVERIPFITTFELTTALGFLYFAHQKVDAAVIEVGLGGRLDATNILLPLVSVITPLSYDHMIVLGNTLAQIAGEKAGIIKAGRPLVSAPQEDEALQVLKRIASERGAPLTLVGQDMCYALGEHSLDGQTFELWTTGGPHLKLSIPLLGAHQVGNAAVAYAALQVANQEGLKVDQSAVQRGFAAVEWPGRFEVLRRNPPLVIDSAHNRASAARLRQALDDYFPGWPVVLLFCTLEDKDVTGILAELSPRLTRVVATQANHPRVLPVEEVVKVVEQANIPVEACAPVAAALRKALELAGERALVLSAGGIAFGGEVRTAWQALGQ
jgi:dihydrofolate synthase/folylpolyglutamate synthase